MNLNASVIALDIETRHASEEYISSAKSLVERKSYNTRLVDPELIEADRVKKDSEYQAALQKIIDKSALLNGAEIGCIGVVIDGSIFLHSTFYDIDPDVVKQLSREGVDGVFTYQTEAEMMDCFREQLDSCTSEFTKVVGHNSFDFDFPKIRTACRRSFVGSLRVAVPKILTPEFRDNQIDTEQLFTRYYNCEPSRRLMVSLDHICEQFKVEYKKGLSGAEIPGAIAAKRYFEVGRDCLSDAIEAFKIYHAMMM